MSVSSSTEKFLVEEYVPDLLKSRSILDQNDTNEYKIDSVQVLPVTTDGTFMLSTCQRVKVNLIEVGNNDNILHLDLVIKLSPNEAPPELVDMMLKPLFRNEILAYTKILPLFPHIDYLPKYYYGSVGEESCSMVLGDFGVDGWRMAPTLVNLSLEHILLTVKYLGKFHGSCYAMKELNNDAFLGIARQLGKTRFEQVTTGQPFYDKYLQLVPYRGVKAVRNSSEYNIDEDFLIEFEKELDASGVLMRDLVQPVEPLATICHGDYLRNNIAFKYDDSEESKTPVGVTMFDFQTMCYTSPMMDLVTFMANSTGRDVRGPHFEEIFRAYHTELINVLCEKLNTEKTDDSTGPQSAVLPPHYSYDSFLREYLRLLPFGYIVATTFISMLHVPMEDNYLKPLPAEEEEAQLQELLVRGGAVVDQELAALVDDIYQLRKRFEARDEALE